MKTYQEIMIITELQASKNTLYSPFSFVLNYEQWANLSDLADKVRENMELGFLEWKAPVGFDRTPQYWWKSWTLPGIAFRKVGES